MVRSKKALVYALFETSCGLDLVGQYPTKAAAEAYAERVRRQFDDPTFEIVGVPIPDARGPFGRGD